MADKVPRLLPVALSLGLANLSHIAIAATDVAMIGQLGAAELAAASLASSLFYLPLFCMLGFVGGAGSALARLLGAGDMPETRAFLAALGAITVIFLLPVLALVWLADSLLLLLGQDTHLIAMGDPYLAWLSWSAPAMAIFAALWTLAALRGHAAAISRISLLAIPVNAAANALFMHGWGGLPAMGLEGAGLATWLTTLLKAAILLGWLYRCRVFDGLFGPCDLRRVLRWVPGVLAYGLPLAALEGATMAFFATIAMMTGLLGTAALAANAVALQAAEIGVALLFGMGEAAAIILSFHRGRRDASACHKAVRDAMRTGLAFAFSYGLILVLIRQPLLGFVLGEEAPMAGDVQALAKVALLLAAASLPLDCGRIVLVGVLRGLDDVRWPPVIAICGLCALGLPLAGWLGLRQGIGLPGIWAGMLIAMAAVSAALYLRLRRMQLNQGARASG